MYAWIWHRLPGNAAVRAGIALLLFLAAVVVLFRWVFPWAEPLLPFGDVTVDNGGTGSVQPSGTSTPAPTSTPKTAPTVNGAGLPGSVPLLPFVTTGVVT